MPLLDSKGSCAPEHHVLAIKQACNVADPAMARAVHLCRQLSTNSQLVVSHSKDSKEHSDGRGTPGSGSNNCSIPTRDLPVPQASQQTTVPVQCLATAAAPSGLLVTLEPRVVFQSTVVPAYQSQPAVVSWLSMWCLRRTSQVCIGLTVTALVCGLLCHATVVILKKGNLSVVGGMACA